MADQYYLSDMALERVRQKLDQARLAGKTVTRPEITALYQAELDTVAKNANAQRAMDVQQSQFQQSLNAQQGEAAANRRLQKDIASGQSTGGLVQAGTTLGSAALLSKGMTGKWPWSFLDKTGTTGPGTSTSLGDLYPDASLANQTLGAPAGSSPASSSLLTGTNMGTTPADISATTPLANSVNGAGSAIGQAASPALPSTAESSLAAATPSLLSTAPAEALTGAPAVDAASTMSSTLYPASTETSAGVSSALSGTTAAAGEAAAGEALAGGAAEGIAGEAATTAAAGMSSAAFAPVGAGVVGGMLGGSFGKWAGEQLGIGGERERSIGGGIVGGAAAGAAIGSVVPGIGTAIGADSQGYFGGR